MNSIKAISQLENLKQDRLSFIHICEGRYLNDVYKNQQITMDTILKDKGKER